MGKGRLSLLPAVSPAADDPAVFHRDNAADRHLTVIRCFLRKPQRLTHHGRIVHWFSLSSIESRPEVHPGKRPAVDRFPNLAAHTFFSRRAVWYGAGIIIPETGPFVNTRGQVRQMSIYFYRKCKNKSGVVCFDCK